MLACLSGRPSSRRVRAKRSSCVLYDIYNAFCTIHIRNVLNATNELASVVCVLYDTYITFCTIHICNVSNATNKLASGVCRTVLVVQSIFLSFPLSVYPCEKTPPALLAPPLTSSLIIPSTGEAGPSSCVLYDTYKYILYNTYSECFERYA